MSNFGNTLTIVGLPIQQVFNFLSLYFLQIFRLCLVSGNFEGKCKGKKIERESRRKEKMNGK